MYLRKAVIRLGVPISGQNFPEPYLSYAIITLCNQSNISNATRS